MTADGLPAPGVRHGMPVSAEAFGALPRPPGWTYEWIDDALSVQADGHAETARWAGPLPRVRSVVRTRPLGPGDADAFLDAADETFRDGPDYFRLPHAVRRASLAGLVADCLELEPAWVRVAATVAEADGQVVGGVLVRETVTGVALHTLCVRPAWQRTGVATALLAAVLRALPPGVAVWSSWHLANRPSAAWHRRAGFETVPTWSAAQSRLSAVVWAFRQGRAAAAERAAALAERDRLWAAERAGDVPDSFVRTAPIHRRTFPA